VFHVARVSWCSESQGRREIVRDEPVVRGMTRRGKQMRIGMRLTDEDGAGCTDGDGLGVEKGL
jgi:hypothetical protein